MGLFDAFKKNKSEETSEASWAKEVEVEDFCVISPEEFETTYLFEGVVGDDFAAGIEFDMENECVRDAEQPDRIYPLCNIHGYQVIIPEKGSMDFIDGLDNVKEDDDVESILINLCTTDYTGRAPLGLCVYQQDWEKEKTNVMDAVAEGKKLVKFLEEIGINEE